MAVLDTFRLSGKVALVTGGARGIGAALAQALAEAGADVAITTRDPARIEPALARLRETGVRAIALDTDVTDADAVKSMVEHVTAELGAIDVLVNNAGISIGAPALETTDDAWNLVVDTNLTGVWRCCREVGKQMVARGTGSIINIGSMSAMIVNRPR